MSLINQVKSKLPSKRREHAVDEVNPTNVEIIPQNGKLLIRSQVRGSKNDIYDSHILFSDVTYNPAEGEKRVQFVSNGDTYEISPIKLQSTDCQVRCSCLDFRWRLAMTDFSDGSLHGSKPPLYRAKTGSKRPPANPAKTPGVCKHLMALVKELQNADLFV